MGHMTVACDTRYTLYMLAYIVYCLLWAKEGRNCACGNFGLSAVSKPGDIEDKTLEFSPTFTHQVFGDR